jgi:hypothetical protein
VRVFRGNKYFAYNDARRHEIVNARSAAGAEIPTHAQLVPPGMIPFQNNLSSKTSRAAEFVHGRAAGSGAF